MNDLITNHKRTVFIALLIAVFSIWMSIISLGDKTFIDEGTHVRQVQRYTKDNYAILGDLTTIPGYHITVAFVSSIAFPWEKQPSLREVRLTSLAFASLSLIVFFLISSRLHLGDPYRRTLQYAVFPITFLYFPLVYTDIFSLLLLLTAFLFALSKRYRISAFVSFLSILVRQDAIVWVTFLWLYTFITEYGSDFSVASVLAHLKKTFGYVMIATVFLVFVWQNGGIALGDQEHHVFGLYPGNIYFFLAMTGLLFMPVTVTTLKNILSVTKNRILLSVLSISLLVGLSFFLLHPALHVYNLDMHFLRNRALGVAYGDFGWLYILLIALGGVTLWSMRLKGDRLLIVPFAIASLLPSLLIEQRYAIVPLIFLLLFREEGSDRAERFLVLYWLAMSLGLTFMLLRLDLFF